MTKESIIILVADIHYLYHRAALSQDAKTTDET